MEEITKNILHVVTFIIGLIGIIIIIIGTLDGLYQFTKNEKFTKIRYIIGKHILLGLDFLVVKDIIETVLLKGSDVHIMDLALLVTIVAIRIALTSHTTKGIQEMREEMAITKLQTKHLEHNVEHLEEEEDELEKKIAHLEKEIEKLKTK